MAKTVRSISRNKTASTILIVLLTAIYLLMTSAGALQGDKIFDDDNEGAQTGLEYQRDPMSYGDMWAFSSGNFNASSYAITNKASNKNIYTSAAGATEKFSLWQYYGKVKIENKKVPTETEEMKNHVEGDFISASSVTTAPGMILEETVPVVSTTNNIGVYTMVPTAKGTYRLYVYSPSDAEGNPVSPNGKVRYHVLDDYASSNLYPTGFKGTAFTATETPTFTQIGTSDWYYTTAGIEVGCVTWSAYKIEWSGTSNETKEVEDENVGPCEGKQVQDSFNAVLGGGGSGSTGNKCRNHWKKELIYYNTLLVLQWDKSVQIGPVTKQGNLTIHADSDTGNDTYTGSVTVKNIFGEEIDFTDGAAMPVWHTPLYLTAVPTEGVFAGFADASNVGLEMDTIADTEVGLEYYVYKFEDASATLKGQWIENVPLPKINVEKIDTQGTTVETTAGNFYDKADVKLRQEIDTEYTYRITLDYSDGAEGSTVTYKLQQEGAEEATEVALAAGASITFVTSIDKWTVTLRAVQSEPVETERTAIVTVEPQVAAGTAYVARNITMNNTDYYFVEDALLHARSGDTIVVTAETASFKTSNPKLVWTSGNGGYTVDSGVTLLLPYTAGEHSFSSTDKFPYANYGETIFTSTTNLLERNDKPVSQGGYCNVKLTIPEGITLHVSGAVSVGGQLSATQHVPSCATYKKYSILEIEKNAKVALQSNGNLSVCGYVIGEGCVETTGTGASVYQPLVIMDFRGGSYTARAASTHALLRPLDHPSGENYVSPFIRFATVNVQTKIVLAYGNFIQGYCDLYAGGQQNQTTGYLVGDGRENTAGVINLAPGADLVATYDAAKYVDAYSVAGQTKLEIRGGASYAELSLHVAIASGVETDIKTSVLCFPIPYNYEITLIDGSYYIDYSMKLSPGCKIVVSEDAKLYLGKNASTSNKPTVMVYEGLRDHTQTGNTTQKQVLVAHGDKGPVPYPSTEELQGGHFKENGVANLIVNGELYLENVKFGGTVQTGGVDTETNTVPLVSVSANATLKATSQTGIVGRSKEVNLVVVKISGYDTAGATVQELDAQLFDPATGTRVKLTSGVTYYGVEDSNIIEKYTYTLYKDSQKTSAKETIDEELKASVVGSWWTYDNPVTVLTSGGEEYVPETAASVKTAHGANLSVSEREIQVDEYSFKISGLYTDDDLADTHKVGEITAKQNLYAVIENEDAPVHLIYGVETTVDGVTTVTQTTKGYLTLTAAEDAYDDLTGTKYAYIQLNPKALGETNTLTESVTLSEDTYLDLNGCTIDGTVTVAERATLYGLNSGNNAYQPTTAGKITTVSGTVAPGANNPNETLGQSYVATEVGEGYTFSRISVSVTDYYLEVRTTGDALVGFGATFRGNNNVVAALSHAGFIINGTEEWITKEELFKTTTDTADDKFTNGDKFFCTTTTTNYGDNTGIALLQIVGGTKFQSEEKSFPFGTVLSNYYNSLDETADADAIRVIKPFLDKLPKTEG